jgi:hypothetical protein
MLSLEGCREAVGEDRYREGYEAACDHMNEVYREDLARMEKLMEAVKFAELRFSAMSESTIENGAPSPTELIGLCNESALKLGLVLTEHEAALERGSK